MQLLKLLYCDSCTQRLNKISHFFFVKLNKSLRKSLLILQGRLWTKKRSHCNIHLILNIMLCNQRMSFTDGEEGLCRLNNSRWWSQRGHIINHTCTRPWPWVHPRHCSIMHYWFTIVSEPIIGLQTMLIIFPWRKYICFSPFSIERVFAHVHRKFINFSWT